MIDCPICHVKNNDDARFCAECGQRLGGQTGPSGAPTEPVPPTARTQPPQADQPTGSSRKLHSPLLNDSADNYPPADIPSSQSGSDVNRLRQMSSRQQDPPPTPDRPYKNPYDPRNDPRNVPPESSSPPQAQEPQRKLRSPLLSGEEFDESEFSDQDPPSNARGGNLRSPLLGGGESTNQGFRSPLLGGGRRPEYEDSDEDQQAGGAGLRSPLLGGGGSYGSDDRRRIQPQTPYGGNERRSGLRSPILGGGGGEDDYQYDDYEDEPADEDNPNVLRSPLLAAKRPLSDRPRNEPTPAGSNMQNPPRPGQIPDLGPNTQNPNSSYTSLRSIRNQGTNPAPQAVPPMPTDAPFAQAQQPGPSPSFLQGGLPQQPGAQQQSASPQINAAQGNAPQPGPPTNVPPSFQRGYVGGPASAEMPISTAQPVRPPDSNQFAPAAPGGTGGGINVQPPTPSRSMPTYQTGTDNDEPLRGRGRPKLLNSQYENDEEEAEYQPNNSRFAVEPVGGPTSVLPKILGGVGVFLLILKGMAFKDFMATDWSKTAWLVTDQTVLLLLIICFIVLCFTRRN